MELTHQPQEADGFGACAVAAEEAEEEDGDAGGGEDGRDLVERDEWTGAGQQVEQPAVQRRLAVNVQREAQPEQRQPTHLHVRL